MNYLPDILTKNNYVGADYVNVEYISVLAVKETKLRTLKIFTVESGFKELREAYLRDTFSFWDRNEFFVSLRIWFQEQIFEKDIYYVPPYRHKIKKQVNFHSKYQRFYRFKGFATLKKKIIEDHIMTVTYHDYIGIYYRYKKNRHKPKPWFKYNPRKPRLLTFKSRPKAPFLNKRLYKNTKLYLTRMYSRYQDRKRGRVSPYYIPAMYVVFYHHLFGNINFTFLHLGLAYRITQKQYLCLARRRQFYKNFKEKKFFLFWQVFRFFFNLSEQIFLLYSSSRREEAVQLATKSKEKIFIKKLKLYWAYMSYMYKRFSFLIEYFTLSYRYMVPFRSLIYGTKKGYIERNLVVLKQTKVFMHKKEVELGTFYKSLWGAQSWCIYGKKKYLLNFLIYMCYFQLNGVALKIADTQKVIGRFGAPNAWKLSRRFRRVTKIAGRLAGHTEKFRRAMRADFIVHRVAADLWLRSKTGGLRLQRHPERIWRYRLEGTMKGSLSRILRRKKLVRKRIKRYLQNNKKRLEIKSARYGGLHTYYRGK